MEAVKSTEPATSNLPELVVDGQDKKKKKTVATKEKAYVAPTTGTAAEAAPPPPGVTLGTVQPSDTGTTSFDAANVKMRTDGGNDANTFMRNLPNVQYQTGSSSYIPGATSTKTVDTKPALLSISGGRTYENNFIVNGVSVSNITGPENNSNGKLDDQGGPASSGTGVHGMSPQNIYVPAEFVGQATVIDSNASAEYGQFQGGVVLYDLLTPPTDRYHASVSASRDTSDFANYILATPDGTNPLHRRAPKYEKTTLAVSLGAPITSDFAFIAQASRKEADSSRPKLPQVGGDAQDNSDNLFFRFAATARTDIGKFTLDTSRTEYTQHWEWGYTKDTYIDVNTRAQSTKLEHETKLPGVSISEIGLGGLNLKSRAFYNTNVTENNSGDSRLIGRYAQFLNTYDAATGTWSEIFHTDAIDWCHPLPVTSGPSTPVLTSCFAGGMGNTLQGQTDYGAQSILSGDVLLGGFKVGAEAKSYEGRNARLEDIKSQLSVAYATVPSGLVCNSEDITCDAAANQFNSSLTLYKKRDVSATVNAVHTFAELDQTWNWFNVRAGVRHDYDDYLKNNNFAPRLVGTVTPLDGISFTAGYNRYYIGETLYYAVRDKVAPAENYRRIRDANGNPQYTPGNPMNDYTLSSLRYANSYTVSNLDTPYTDEFTAAVGVRDPLTLGKWRLRYLERFGHDQFGTSLCTSITTCTTVANNDGDDFYRSASAEYTKEWNRLRNPYGLNAAAITGNVTWSEQHTSQANYLLSADSGGDGSLDTGAYYNGKGYRAEQFREVTGNLDIPVRFGATLSTVWFDDLLELNVSAGVNLGFQGVYDTGSYNYVDPVCAELANGCNEYTDMKYGTSLKLDVNGQINVTEQASIQFSANNLTNSTQQTITRPQDPYVLGRSYYLGSSLRF